MSWEDIYFEIHEDIAKRKLKKEFDAQLKKMSSQDKHKYIETREKWKYAYEKVIKENKK